MSLRKGKGDEAPTAKDNRPLASLMRSSLFVSIRTEALRHEDDVLTMSSDVIVDLPTLQYTTRDRDTEVSRSCPAEENHTDDAYSDSDSDADQDEGVQHGTCDLDAALQAAMPTSVYMEGSRDVQIGSRLHYNAPVTIKQYVHVLRPDSETREEAVAEPRTNGNNNSSCSNKPQEYTPGVTVTTVKPPLSPTHWGIISGAAILIIAGLMVTVYYFKTGGPSSTNPPPAEDMPVLPPPEPNSTLPNGHRIISKPDWRGRPPKYVRPLVQPTPYVVITHTAGNRCSDFNTCAAQLRNIQDQHVGENNMADIGYNFCVGDDGNIYVGRGWDVTNKLDGWVKFKSIAICFLGNYVYEYLNTAQIESTQQLLKLGVEWGKLHPEYRLVAHNQTTPTLSPGTNVYDVIQNWPHFFIPFTNNTSHPMTQLKD
uniref:(California timema) hypothetical protein n=1 Tax=Timema californicum TaxID=61474 RepID=A0A7R9JDM9_TIMCA|nr:unnamed protein product [Timema californicum]